MIAKCHTVDSSSSVVLLLQQTRPQTRSYGGGEGRGQLPLTHLSPLPQVCDGRFGSHAQQETRVDAGHISLAPEYTRML